MRGMLVFRCFDCLVLQTLTYEFFAISLAAIIDVAGSADYFSDGGVVSGF